MVSRSVVTKWQRATTLLGLALVSLGCNADDDEVLPGGGGSGGAGGDGGAAGVSLAVDLELDPFYPVDLAGGVAPTPPMGWNSWNEFGCSATKVSAESVMAIGDAMVDSGMKEAGYEYVNIDDCWLEAERTADGTLQPTEGFPAGIEPVAEYLHGLGLKLGIYGDRATTTCARRAGSQGNEALDADTWVAWGVDYLKYDNCCYEDSCTYDEAEFRERYELMGAELQRAAREAGRDDLVYSICAWWFYEWAADAGHLQRTTSDIEAEWSSIRENLSINWRYAAYAGPNRWNDSDMLEVGVRSSRPDLRFTEDEERAHFAMWAMMAAPLIAGNDLTSMSDLAKDILTHEEIIAIDQDPLGLQGVPVRWEPEAGAEESTSVWVKPLNESGTRAIALLNDTTEAVQIKVTWEEAGLQQGPARVRDVWAREDLGWFRDEYTATVRPRAAVVLRVTGNEPAVPTGNAYLSDLPWIYAANAVGRPERDATNGTDGNDGEPITLDGTRYEKGLGVAAGSKLIYRIGQNCTRFTATVGLDDSAGASSSVQFKVLVEGDEELAATDVIGPDSPEEALDVDVTGRHRLSLQVTNAFDGGQEGADRFAVWADARLECDEP